MCVRYRELPNTQRFEAWLFSLSINIQCKRFASLGVVSILSLISLFRIFYRRSSPTRIRFRSHVRFSRSLSIAFSLHHSHFSLFFRTLFLSHSFILTTHFRVRQDIRDFYEHASRGSLSFGTLCRENESTKNYSST